MGLTLSQMLGLSGDYGFIVGFSVFFVLFTIAIVKARNLKAYKNDRDELVERLGDEVVLLRLAIFDNFIALKSDGFGSGINDASDGGQELGEIFNELNGLRESEFLSDKVKPIGKKVD